MSRRTTYEWVVETLDEESEDILDCDYYDESDLRPALRRYARINGKADFGLCRHVIDDAEGETERQYAYADGFVLPEDMDGGARVPARFHKALYAALNATTAAGAPLFKEKAP